jgi:hypothetical protein
MSIRQLVTATAHSRTARCCYLPPGPVKPPSHRTVSYVARHAPTHFSSSEPIFSNVHRTAAGGLHTVPHTHDLLAALRLLIWEVHAACEGEQRGGRWEAAAARWAAVGCVRYERSIK